MAPTPRAPAPPVPQTVDPAELAAKLAGIQPGWPGPRFPVPRRPRDINCRRVKCVALTYDDGPGEHTGKLLDMLAKYRARATFFVLGQMVAEDTEHNIRRMVRAGHQLGNHTWDHQDLAALPEEGIRSQLSRTQEIVKRLTGIRMTLMRPPYGSTNDMVAAEASSEGLAQILWSVDTLDWRDRVTSTVIRRATAATPGSIVLMHDIHATTVDATPRVLEHFAARGYRFVTLSELYGKPLTPGRKYVEGKDYAYGQR
ncbi:polysaccharide deacetylase family protein [Streptosporangium sp. NPDC000396]|uniref:polysaccharide deacetylase family protein n=1 Tax=Streptosporangium sp. NPDC000396 TaxID=3366185 RepID=UPI0036CFFEBF